VTVCTVCIEAALTFCGSRVDLKLSDQLSNYLSAKFVDMLLDWRRKLKGIYQTLAVKVSSCRWIIFNVLPLYIKCLLVDNV